MEKKAPLPKNWVKSMNRALDMFESFPSLLEFEEKSFEKEYPKQERLLEEIGCGGISDLLCSVEAHSLAMGIYWGYALAKSGYKPDKKFLAMVEKMKKVMRDREHSKEKAA